MSYTIVVTDLPVGECHTEKHTFLTDKPLVVQKETHTHTHTSTCVRTQSYPNTHTTHNTHAHHSLYTRISSKPLPDVSSFSSESRSRLLRLAKDYF